MKALLFAAGLAVVAGCSLVQGPAEPVWALLIVNTSDAEAAVVLDQGGREDRLPVGPCSASTHGLGPGHNWRVEFGGPIVREADLSLVPNAPVTVVEVAISPDGEVSVRAPRGAATVPDAEFVGGCAPAGGAAPQPATSPGDR